MSIILLVAFILIPIVEVYLIIQVGQVIGAWWTVGLLVGVSVAGAWLVKREGRRTWRALQEGMRGAALSGRLPDREVVDAGLVLVGGTLLLTPGFVTDAAGLLCIVPFLRPVTRSVLRRIIWRRVLTHAGAAAGPRSARRSARRPESGQGPGQVVQGEVIDPDDERR